MTTWTRRVRGAIGMGITWAIAWALFGLLIGVTSVLVPGLPFWDDFFRVYDAPLPTLAIPGFIGGALFSLVLGTLGRRRRFDELSMPRFAAWGAVGGLLVSLVPTLLVVLGLATLGDAYTSPWQLTAMIAGPLAFLSAASAAGSLALARRAQQREPLGEGAHANGDRGASMSRSPHVIGSVECFGRAGKSDERDAWE